MALKTLADIATFTRDRLRESSANAWTDVQVVRAINETFNSTARRLKKQHPTYLHDTVTITYVADQATYSLPQTFWGLLAYPLRTDLSPDSIIGHVPFEAYHKYLGMTAGWFVYNSEHFTFQGSEGDLKLRITPAPATGGATLNLDFIRRPPELHSGTAATTTNATQITFPTTANATYGTVDNRNDYYNGSSLYIYGATALGTTAEITDYVGSTHVASVVTATADNTSIYTILPPWPEEFNYLLAFGAAALLLEDLGIQSRFAERSAHWTGLMLSSIDRTQVPKYLYIADTDRYR